MEHDFRLAKPQLPIARELAAEMAGVEWVYKVGDHVKSIHRAGGVLIKVNKAGIQVKVKSTCVSRMAS